MSDTTNSNPKNKNLNEEELGLKGVLDEVISEAGDSTPNAPQASPAEDAQKALRDEALFRSIEKKKKKEKKPHHLDGYDYSSGGSWGWFCRCFVSAP